VPGDSEIPVSSAVLFVALRNQATVTVEQEQLTTPWPSKIVESGWCAGWTQFVSDPFEAHAGPFFHRRLENRTIVCRMRVEPKHLNGGGFVHGGALMAFADFALFAIAQDELHEDSAVTATFNSEFISAVPCGADIECTGEVVRATRSLIFLRGVMHNAGTPVLTFSAVLKKIRRSRTA
jgi:uncharacterized protein (TIGR00369 family)